MDRIQGKAVIRVKIISEDRRTIWRSADFQAESTGVEHEWNHRLEQSRVWQKTVKGDRRATEEGKDHTEPSPFPGTSRK